MVVTPREYPELARLWQEQVDPAEHVSLHALEKDIKRIAKGRWLFDFLMGALCVAVISLELLIRPMGLPNRMAFVFVMALVVWAVWRRRQIAKSARALVVGEPVAFFAAAIENARTELKFSTASLFMAAPAGFGFFVAMLATQRGTGIGHVLGELFGAHLVKTMLFAVVLALGYFFFTRANIRLREQLRRLEAMSRECAEEDARDLTEEH